ncbi:CPBP family intramembrane metalloprotease [Lactobacillus sp. DCY120]|uniref:CPBP family intramembrane metalloprotease n=1 Tax=Bombilactobacillus apium TaxID=2675299 RepID=A0A850R5X8_9LACO|nr:type II CAAX endopeptidase family protein [Bombilactobacillus apium]NVY96247.1 CPBP family intramembrane metalloprotease [Bombilactobacillus apium]
MSQPASTKRFGGIALITIIFSFIWTGTSRLLSVVSPTGYDDFFHNSSTVFWHVVVPVGLTLIIFLVLMAKMGRINQIYFRQEPPLRSGAVKATFIIIPILMIIFALWIFGGSLRDILANHWGPDALLRLLAIFIGTGFVGCLEESVFRGFALTEARKTHGEGQSYLISIFLFGLWHLPNIVAGAPILQSCIQFVTTMILGSGFYMVLRSTGKLSAAIGLHWFWDFAVTIGQF